MTAATMTWHPGMESCGFCDHPATRIVQAGNGSTAKVCDNHIRCGTGVSDGDHNTYLAEQTTMAHLQDR